MPQDITGHTTLYCLLGHPVAHSISPQMHNLAFKALGIDARYLAFDVQDGDAGAALDAMKTLGIRGCNLTMPLKRSIIPCLDELSEASALCGACNTVKIREDGSAFGDTTDGIGFLDSLDAAGFSFRGKTICLLGPGGAGASIAAAAALGGASALFLCKRKNTGWEDTQAFAESINAKTSCRTSVVDCNSMSEMSAAVSGSQLLINATPVGMADAGDLLRTPLDASLLHPGLFVSDIIYHPGKTKLLQDAEAAGCRIMNGRYMLMYQGAASFQLWTGQSMPVELVRDAFFS